MNAKIRDVIVIAIKDFTTNSERATNLKIALRLLKRFGNNLPKTCTKNWIPLTDIQNAQEITNRQLQILRISQQITYIPKKGWILTENTPYPRKSLMTRIALLLFLGLTPIAFSSCSSHTKKVFVPGMGTLQIRKNATKEEIDRIVQDTYHAKLDWMPVR